MIKAAAATGSTHRMTFSTGTSRRVPLLHADFGHKSFTTYNLNGYPELLTVTVSTKDRGEVGNGMEGGHVSGLRVRQLLCAPYKV